MKLFDTHTHLADKDLENDLEEILSNSVEAKIGGVGIISADEATLVRAPQIAKKIEELNALEFVVYSSGIHPHDSKALSDSLKKQITELSEGAHAIGETGLDYYYEHSDKKAQIDAFEFHIDLALKSSKPLVIHSREAKQDVSNTLKTAGISNHPNPGVLHCFVDDYATAKELIDLGFFISFSGILTFNNASELQEVAKKLPLDRILIETDTPWLSPKPLRGKRNQPSHVRHVFDKLLELREESPEKIAEQLWKNSLSLYNIG